MKSDYIALAVPVFFVLIALELLAARFRGLRVYRLGDSLDNFATGVLQQLVSALGVAWIVGAYVFVYETTAIFDWPADRPGTWIVCFVLTDLAYYWFHRLSHEVNFLWAVHIAHHQSEEYNLSVALRQGAFQPLFSAVFYWPLAVIGLPPVVFVACAAFDTLYQFWIHTRLIDRLGPLEAVLMTPSHHRVHHGRNPTYIDRNHGGTFIVWDKLFGTFQREEEEVVFGITKPLESWNPLWANFHYWIELGRDAVATRRPIDKLKVFLMPPGWRPADLGGYQPPPAIPESPEKYDPRLARSAAAYAILQFAQVLVLGGLLTAAQPRLSWSAIALAASLLTWALVDIGALCEGRPWFRGAEWARVASAPLLALLIPGEASGWIAGALLLNLPALLWLTAAAATGNASEAEAHGGSGAVEARGQEAPPAL